MLNKKQKNLILIILTISLIIGFSGVKNLISEDNSYNNKYYESYGDYSTYDSSYENNSDENIINTSKSESNNKTYFSINKEVETYCNYVVDGDTIDCPSVGRIRLVGVNTPERGEPGYKEAKDYVKRKCLGKKIYLDIDDKKRKDKYGRTLAIVYVGDENINRQLLEKNYAEIMYIPPSEFPKGLYGT